MLTGVGAACQNTTAIATMTARAHAASANHFSCWRSAPCDLRNRTTRDTAAPMTPRTRIVEPMESRLSTAALSTRQD